jgi:peptide-methionine (R)-S-oxide reductase
MPTIPFLSGLFSSSSSSQSNMSHPDQRSPDEWRAVLNKGKLDLITESLSCAKFTDTSAAEQFRILREKGTEAPYSGKYDKHYPSEGVYACAACNAPLYKATQKFKSGCGWPAYFDSIPGAVTRHEDRAFGMARTEIVCTNCGGHLGHVFKGEGFPTPTDERHCVNSVSLTFSPDDKASEQKSATGSDEGASKA